MNLEKLVEGLSIDLTGVADIRDLEDSFHPSIPRGIFSRAVVIGLKLHDGVLDTIKDRPTLIYKHHYKTVNWLLDQKAFEIARRLENGGFRALAVAASQTIDWENQRGALSHKLLGQKAGLGFIGKSGLLVHPLYGPRMRLATVLTDAGLEPTEEVHVENMCGTCRACIEACPAGAITDEGYNMRKCLEKLREFAALRGIGQFICGICIAVCPVGKEGLQP